MLLVTTREGEELASLARVQPTWATHDVKLVGLAPGAQAVGVEAVPDVPVILGTDGSVAALLGWRPASTPRPCISSTRTGACG